MKTKYLFIIIPLVVVLLVTGFIIWVNHVKYYPKRVIQLPNGYIHLQESIENTEGVMKYVFFEEYISFVDIEGNSVGGALVRNRSFIIEYHGEYYVNENEFKIALEKARIKAGVES